MQDADNFKTNIEAFVSLIPEGCVTTYGDLASLAGHAYAARAVGGIAHYGDPLLPWHRVVNRFGGLASGFPGGKELHEKILESEGIHCTDFIVDNFKDIRWQSKI